MYMEGMEKIHTFCLKFMFVSYQIEGRKYVLGITYTIDYTPLDMSSSNFSLECYKMEKKNSVKLRKKLIKKCLLYYFFPRLYVVFFCEDISVANILIVHFLYLGYSLQYFYESYETDNTNRMNIITCGTWSSASSFFCSCGAIAGPMVSSSSDSTT